MSRRVQWINEQVAPTLEAMRIGDGCHKDEGKSLNGYLEGSLTPSEAAVAITGPVLQDPNPPQVLYRLMGLLCGAMVNLSDDLEKLIDLIASIQQLPPTAQVKWCELPGFHSMWADLYRLHFHGLSGWERLEAPIRNASEAGVREENSAAAAAEARMYVRGIGGIPPDWGYKTISLICWERPRLESHIIAMHCWLVLGGTKLKQDLKPNEWKRYQGVEATMAEHWGKWKRSLLEASKKEASLSEEVRDLAFECSRLMEGDI